MKFGLKKPCPECPFMAKVKGWIGGHETAMDFHEMVRSDMRMPCHMTVNQDHPEVSDGRKHHCAGYAMYMNAMYKRSRDPQMSDFQDSVRKIPHDGLLFSFDGSALVEFHSKAGVGSCRQRS